MHNAKPPGATESTVLGPFFTEDAHDGIGFRNNIPCLFHSRLSHLVQNGGTIASEGKGDYMYIEGRVTDIHGRPIPNAVIETWETDQYGLYDTQVNGLLTC